MADATGDVHVRRAQRTDWERLQQINQAAVPGVNSLAPSEFEAVMAVGSLALVAARDEVPVGFVLLMTEGLAYPSLNYRWLSDRYDQFAYVDRVAVSPEARGQGLGQALYQSMFRELAGVRPVVLAEVNLAPPNPGSLRFHESHGFSAVGQRWSDDRSKGVVYLARPLS